MSATLTTMTYTQWSQVALEAFVNYLAPVSAFAVNANYNVVERGATVKVPNISNMTAATFAGAYATGSSTATGLDITIGTEDYVDIPLTDTQMADTPNWSLERYAKQAGEALAAKVQDTIFAQILSSSYISGSAVNSLSYTGLVNLNTSGSTMKWPLQGRSLIVSPALYGSALTDTTIAQVSSIGTSEPIRQGKLVNVAGFESIYQSSILPKVQTDSKTLNGFACVPDAILVAFRTVQPGPDAAKVMSYETVPHPSGITMLVKSFYDPVTQLNRRILSVSYGYRVGNSTGLYRLTSA